MPDTTIQLAPWLAMLQPIAFAVVSVGVPIALGYVRQYTGIQVSQANADALTKAIQDQAGLLIAKSPTNLSFQSIDPHHPDIAKAVNWMGTAMPKLLAATGKTPDDVAHMIAAEIGKLQVQQPVAPLVGPYVAPRT